MICTMFQSLSKKSARIPGYQRELLWIFHVKEYSKLVGSNENVALGMVAGKRSGCWCG
jgi:hypothetical protein